MVCTDELLSAPLHIKSVQAHIKKAVVLIFTG